MVITILFAAIMLGLFIATVVLWGILLRLGLRWAKIDGVTTSRIVYATIGVTVLQIAVNCATRTLMPSAPAHAIVFSLASLAAYVGGSCLAIALIFGAPLLRTPKAWLPTLLAPILPLLIVVFVTRPFAFEAYSIPTNSMAPTLLGAHWQGACPQCGQPMYCTPPRYYGRNASEPSPMICERFHVSKGQITDEREFPADRLTVAKFIAPKRWDLVVFQYPGNPSINYVKRLVGLPGETIHIADGAVWANGEKLTPPEALAGIEYLSEMPESGGFPQEKLWGSASRPATLDADEYFMLGDFSAQSADSRLWLDGAPGHHPFAVPKSYLIGVVANIYWPPQRWRILHP